MSLPGQEALLTERMETREATKLPTRPRVATPKGCGAQMSTVPGVEALWAQSWAFAENVHHRTATGLRHLHQSGQTGFSAGRRIPRPDALLRHVHLLLRLRVHCRSGTGRGSVLSLLWNLG